MQLIVAVNAEQVGRLDNLYDRGIKNEVPDLKVVGPEEIRDIEPNCVVNVMNSCWLLTWIAVKVKWTAMLQFGA